MAGKTPVGVTIAYSILAAQQLDRAGSSSSSELQHNEDDNNNNNNNKNRTTNNNNDNNHTLVFGRAEESPAVPFGSVAAAVRAMETQGIVGVNNNHENDKVGSTSTSGAGGRPVMIRALSLGGSSSNLAHLADNHNATCATIHTNGSSSTALASSCSLSAGGKDRYRKPVSSFRVFLEGTALYMTCLILPSVLGHLYQMYLNSEEMTLEAIYRSLVTKKDNLMIAFAEQDDEASDGFTMATKLYKYAFSTATSSPLATSLSEQAWYTYLQTTKYICPTPLDPDSYYAYICPSEDSFPAMSPEAIRARLFSPDAEYHDVFIVAFWATILALVRWNVVRLFVLKPFAANRHRYRKRRRNTGTSRSLSASIHSTSNSRRPSMGGISISDDGSEILQALVRSKSVHLLSSNYHMTPPATPKRIISHLTIADMDADGSQLPTVPRIPSGTLDVSAVVVPPLTTEESDFSQQVEQKQDQEAARRTSLGDYFWNNNDGSGGVDGEDGIIVDEKDEDDDIIGHGVGNDRNDIDDDYNTGSQNNDFSWGWTVNPSEQDFNAAASAWLEQEAYFQRRLDDYDDEKENNYPPPQQQQMHHQNQQSVPRVDASGVFIDDESHSEQSNRPLRAAPEMAPLNSARTTPAAATAQHTSSLASGISTSYGNSLYAAPRFATGFFRLIYSIAASCFAWYWLHNANFWPWYVGGKKDWATTFSDVTWDKVWSGEVDHWNWLTGSSATRYCWDLSGGLSVGMDADFDQRNTSLRRLFLMQASYHVHSGAFHILSIVMLLFRKLKTYLKRRKNAAAAAAAVARQNQEQQQQSGKTPTTTTQDASKSKKSNRRTSSWLSLLASSMYFGSLVQHMLTLLLIGTAYIFSSLRRLAAIGMFAFDVSSCFLHLLQLCINAPPNSWLSRPFIVKSVYRFLVLPSFVITRFFIWPLLWYSTIFESQEWLQQLENTSYPGIADAMRVIFHVWMASAMALNIVYFRRLYCHEHLRRVIKDTARNNNSNNKTSAVTTKQQQPEQLQQ